MKRGDAIRSLLFVAMVASLIAALVTLARAEQPRLIERPATRPAKRLVYVKTIQRQGFSDGTVEDTAVGVTILLPGDNCAKKQ